LAHLKKTLKIEKCRRGHHVALAFMALVLGGVFASSTFASDQTIDSTYEYAWEENVGWISLNCSNDSSCGSNNYAVANNGSGTLSGYGWSDTAGWVNFNPTYGGVSINASSGEFTGYAWGENIGWISFNCSNDSSCGTNNYKVETAAGASSGGGSGIQVSSRIDTLSNSQPSATSNHSFAFTTNTQITGSSTITLTYPGAFTIPGALNCGDVDAATSSQFNFNYPSCAATATAWGFSISGPALILQAPTDSTSTVHVATGTPITIKIGSNATYQQTGTHWITNPSTVGTYTITVGGTFGGSGNMLVSINAGQTVQATVAENLSFTVSSVQAANCTADDGATVTKIDSVGGTQASSTIFSYTGAGASWTVPVGVNSITINAKGAGSGAGGPRGGSSTGTLAVTPGTTYYINIGGTAGYNGGGSTGYGNSVGAGMTWFSASSTFSLSASPSIILVAGGAGGQGYDDYPGSGGGLTGGDEAPPGEAKGGTQTSGGANGITNCGTTTPSGFGQGGGAAGGGGGGGWYGGGTGSCEFGYYAGGGGGGSGYVKSTLTNASTTQGAGAASGTNGSLTLTYAVTLPPAVPFGFISPNTFYQGCQDLIVSTNALAGYSLSVQEKYAMRTANGLYTIPDTTCDAGDCSVVTATTWVTPTNYGLGHTCKNITGSDCNASYGTGADSGKKFKPIPQQNAGTAFPTTGILDNFNRDDENPLANGTWTCPMQTGLNNLQLVSNQVNTPSGSANCYWSASSFGPDTETYVKVAAKPTANGLCVALAARISGAGGSISGYWGEFCTQSGTDTWDLYRFDNGTPTHIGTQGTAELTNGDSMGLQVMGNSVKLYYKPASGSWTVMSSATNSTYSGSGRIGLHMEDIPSQTDDFGGGTIGSATMIMSNSGPVASTTGRAKYRLSISPGQTAGTYTTVITYTILGTF
jgi:hypothetical protein